MIRTIKKIIPSNLKQLLKKIKYKGSQFLCPVCNSNLNSFLPLSDRYNIPIEIHNQTYSTKDGETINMDNYLCPICNASDRERLYSLFFNKKLHELDKVDKQKLLHFAPEKSLYNFITNMGLFTVRTADLFMQDVDDKVNITNMDNYEDQSFDCFICSHVLEHVPDDVKAMSELFRILKVGGWGIAMVPIILNLNSTYEDSSIVSEEERLKHFGQEDHVRVYAKQDFINKLKNVGFSVREYGVNYFGKETFKKAGITEQSVLYIVEKLVT